MQRRLSTAARLALLLATLGLVACDAIKPTGQTSLRQLDKCRDCPPGLFSGEDGVLTLYGGEVEVVRKN